MKHICKYLGIATLVLGTIGSFFLAKKFGVEYTSRSFYETPTAMRNWLLTIAYFASGIFTTTIPAAILLGISQLLDQMENRTRPQTEFKQDSSANKEIRKITQSEIKPKNLSSQPSIRHDPIFWQCPECGKYNELNAGVCDCGCEKP